MVSCATILEVPHQLRGYEEELQWTEAACIGLGQLLSQRTRGLKSSGDTCKDRIQSPSSLATCWVFQEHSFRLPSYPKSQASVCALKRLDRNKATARRVLKDAIVVVLRAMLCNPGRRPNAVRH